MADVLGESKDKEGRNYTEADLQRLIGEATKYGAVHALFHLDAHGPDKEKVRALLVDYVAALTKEPGVLYCRGTVEEAIDLEGTYSTAAEVRLLAENFKVLNQLALKYGPIAIELLAPSQVKLDAEQATQVLLDSSESMQRFSAYIMEKVLSAEDKTKFQEHLKRRAELAEKVIEGTPDKPPEGSA
jgi:hypothetical protein